MDVPENLIAIPAPVVALIHWIQHSNFEEDVNAFYAALFWVVINSLGMDAPDPDLVTLMVHMQYRYNQTNGETVDTGIVLDDRVNWSRAAILIEESKPEVTGGAPTIGQSYQRGKAHDQLLQRVTDDDFHYHIANTGTWLLWAITAIGVQFAVWEFNFETGEVFRLRDGDPGRIEVEPLDPSYPEDAWSNSIDVMMTDQFLIRALSTFRVKMQTCIANVIHGQNQQNAMM